MNGNRDDKSKENSRTDTDGQIRREARSRLIGIVIIFLVALVAINHITWLVNGFITGQDSSETESSTNSSLSIRDYLSLSRISGRASAPDCLVFSLGMTALAITINVALAAEPGVPGGHLGAQSTRSHAELVNWRTQLSLVAAIAAVAAMLSTIASWADPQINERVVSATLTAPLALICIHLAVATRMIALNPTTTQILKLEGIEREIAVVNQRLARLPGISYMPPSRIKRLMTQRVVGCFFIIPAIVACTFAPITISYLTDPDLAARFFLLHAAWAILAVFATGFYEFRRELKWTPRSSRLANLGRATYAGAVLLTLIDVLSSFSPSVPFFYAIWYTTFVLAVGLSGPITIWILLANCSHNQTRLLRNLFYPFWAYVEYLLRRRLKELTAQKYACQVNLSRNSTDHSRPPQTGLI